MIGFYHIELDLGNFLTKYIRPVIAKLEKYIQPIEPLINFLESDVPGISAMSVAAGHGPIKVMELVELLDPTDFSTAAQFLDVAEAVVTIANELGTSDGSFDILFGNFVLGGGNGVDLTQAGWNDPNTQTSAQKNAECNALSQGQASMTATPHEQLQGAVVRSRVSSTPSRTTWASPWISSSRKTFSSTWWARTPTSSPGPSRNLASALTGKRVFRSSRRRRSILSSACTLTLMSSFRRLRYLWRQDGQLP